MDVKFAEVLSTPCKTEVRLMFHHLDANSDGILSEQELYQIEHDKVRRHPELENWKRH